MRLLQLPDDVQELVQRRELSAGHARALITSENASDLARKVVKSGMSVRATEALVRKEASGDKPKAARKPAVRSSEKDADTKALEADLSSWLKMQVSIDHKPGTESGSVTISYETLDQLDELCGILSR